MKKDNTELEPIIFKKGLSRRTFLKGCAATAVGVGAVSLSPTTTMQALAEVDEAQSARLNEEVLYNTPCRSNCFQSCLLNAHVIDGKVVKTTRKDYPEEIYSGCCLKGLSLVQRTYSPTRLKYPMRRVGERGSDQWERISWDEAINEIAEKFTSTQQNYGDQAVVVDTGSGKIGRAHV